jgi:hypothetical protein
MNIFHRWTVEDCEADQFRLTELERGFVSFIRRQLEQGCKLSPKQVEMLDGIWERATARG